MPRLTSLIYIAGPLDLSDSNAVAELLEPHQLVAELRLNPACNITSSALSENAQWIAVADVESARLFTMHQSVSSCFAIS